MAYACGRPSCFDATPKENLNLAVNMAPHCMRTVRRGRKASTHPPVARPSPFGRSPGSEQTAEDLEHVKSDLWTPLAHLTQAHCSPSTGRGAAALAVRGGALHTSPPVWHEERANTHTRANIRMSVMKPSRATRRAWASRLNMDLRST